MQDADLLKEHAPKPGSDAYYAVVFAPKATRPALRALFCLAQHLARLGKHAKDPTVAQQQLEWWHSEIKTLGQASSQHPYLRALSGVRQSSFWQVQLTQALNGMAQAASEDLMQSRYLDRPALMAHLRHAYGSLGYAMALLLCPPSLDESSWLSLANRGQRLGTTWGLGQLLVDLPEDALSGHVYVPVSDLQAASIRAHELIKGLTGQLSPTQEQDRQASFQKMLEYHTTWFENELELALSGATQEQLSLLKPLLMLVSLTRQSVGRLRREARLDGNLWSEPSPLGKFWSAWKMQALGCY